MQHIKDYMTKIEQALTVLNKSKTKSKKGGLLSPSEDRQSDKPSKTNDLMVIAKYVNGIRSAKEEMKNGN
jgi:hypothetical protein